MPDPQATTLRNTVTILGDTNLWHYLTRPNHVAFHDLTKGKTVPKKIGSILGLSKKFIPVPPHSVDGKDLEESLNNFERDCHLKVYFAGDRMDKKSILYVKSKWRPPVGSIPGEVDRRLFSFFCRLKHMFVKKKGEPNLLPFQQRLLAWLQHHESWMVANTDKNLGPCIIEIAQYIKDALKHLNDVSTYQPLSKDEAKAEIDRLDKEIWSWGITARKNKAISLDAIKYIRKHTADNMKDPFGYFYLMYKVHKMVKGQMILKTRPVSSDCASITHPLGKWVDEMLKPIVQKLPTYFKDSFAFKELTEGLVLSPRARLVTADAVGMYTNINTQAAMAIIAPYLRDQEQYFDHYDAETLISALEIVMFNNIIKFGDVYRKQIQGTVMGTAPAPQWANLFEGLHEKEFIPRFQLCLPFFKRFIDDDFLVWDPPETLANDEKEAKWIEFKTEVGNNHGLEWEFSERSHSAIFLDMKITIRPDGRLKTTLYEKPMALHLFIPPHSAHPPGVLVGHIFGNILRIFRLNSDEEDIIDDTKRFYHRFCQRGHTSESIKPLFLAGIKNARKFLATSQQERDAIKLQKGEAASRTLYLHIEYHPQNPPSHEIQQLFANTVLHPPGKRPFNQIDVYGREKVPVDAMTIAYHRAHNIGDILSYRDVSKKFGPPVSSYF